MSSVADHYRQLLSEHYIWMFGVSFEEKVAEQKVLLERVLNAMQPPVPGGPALDLGSGPGFQSIALAQLGFSPVVAVDTSVELLRELKTRGNSDAIEIRNADITALDTIDVPSPPAIVVCMGDTITHLASRQEVEKLFAAVYNRLAPGGLLILTFRDLTNELIGTDRFLSVRSDDHKLMTCFLEYESADSVVVHDLVHLRHPNGWTLEKSSYRKLRLSSDWAAAALCKAGFTVELQEPGRMYLIAARKP